MTDDLEAQEKSVQEMLAEYWEDDWMAKLRGHSRAHQRVNAAIARYFSGLKQLGPERDKVKILETMRSLFEELDRVNEAFGGGLLETDERELLVPEIIQAAKTAGLDVDEFEYGDPTLSFRTF